MFPALRKKTIISSVSLVSKMQSEPKQTNYLCAQTVKTPLQNIIKQNNMQIQNAAQQQ